MQESFSAPWKSSGGGEGPVAESLRAGAGEGRGGGTGTEGAGGWPVEMLKMKIDPTMYMKTNVRRQNVHLSVRPFTRECSKYGIIDTNCAGLLPEGVRTT